MLMSYGQKYHDYSLASIDIKALRAKKRKMILSAALISLFSVGDQYQ